MNNLELAEAYYTVARDLEVNAQEQLRIATMLSQAADRLCEKNMRDQKCECGGLKPAPTYPCGACGKVA